MELFKVRIGALVVITYYDVVKLRVLLNRFTVISGAHYHSEHPLDFTEYLQGQDSSDGTTFAQMGLEFNNYLMWLCAHHVNRLEWVLLCDGGSKPSCVDRKRTVALKSIVQQCHDWGIAAYVDVGFAIIQVKRLVFFMF
jgi:hypothetical protein